MSNRPWYEIFGMHFFRIDDPGSWMDEMTASMRTVPTDTELTTAVREIAADPDAPDKPMLRHIMRQIIRTRREEIKLQSCGDCKDGWVLLESAETGRRVSVPCECPLGVRWKRKMGDQAP